jgi:hypothetical protein
VPEKEGILMKKQASLTLETEQREPPVERLLPKPQSDGLSTVLALIQRVAVDPCADVEKLERMIAMYERLKAKEAELAIQRSEGPDPKEARRHQDRQEQVRSIRSRNRKASKGHL